MHFRLPDLTEDKPRHILLFVADLDENKLRIYDSNGSNLLDKHRNNADKQYQDIGDAVAKGFKDKLGYTLITEFLPSSDLGTDKGDCAIYALKAAVCEIEGKTMPKSFLQDTRKNFRKWLVKKLLIFTKTVWDSFSNDMEI